MVYLFVDDSIFELLKKYFTKICEICAVLVNKNVVRIFYANFSEQYTLWSSMQTAQGNNFRKDGRK